MTDLNWAEWINPFGPEFLLGGGTARAQSPSDTRRCNHPCQAVAPPRGSVFELYQAVQPPLTSGGNAQRLSLRALPSDATAPVRRCNRQTPKFWEMTVLSSEFKLVWSL